MIGVINFLKGSARVELRCKYSERAVNLCARAGVDFWELERGEDGAARMTVSLPGYIRLREVARDSGAFTVKIVGRRGVPFFLWRVRKRHVLLLGLILCIAAVTVSAFFVWQIDVVGNETVPSSEILAALQSLGVDIGTSTLSISQEWISTRMLLLVPELSFISLNTHGSRIEVIVREKIPKPETFDPDIPISVEAAKAGIITKIEVTDGWAIAAEGDTVDTGDELISAYIPVGKGSLTHAAGRIWARTWYELELSIPLESARKAYTGEQTSRFAVILGGKRINFYFSGGNPYAYYDKITTVQQVTMKGGAVMPLTIIRETYEEYDRVETVLTVEEAVRILSAELLSQLEREIGDGAVTSKEFETTARDGLVTVTLRAECLEEIGAERQLTDEEIAAYEEAQEQTGE